MNKLCGISAKLSRSAKKEHTGRVTDHRKATYKMISYAYKMCAVFETIGVDFEEPADLEWHTVAMFISKYEEAFKDIIAFKDTTNEVMEEERRMQEDSEARTFATLSKSGWV